MKKGRSRALFFCFVHLSLLILVGNEQIWGLFFFMANSLAQMDVLCELLHTLWSVMCM